MARSVPSAVVVSCHLERPLDDEAWRRFVALARRQSILTLMRPPHEGEDEQLWLERAREAAALGPFGHHTHWTSPTHARPTGGDPARRVREEAEWLRAHGLTPTHFCGGGWYMDEGVAGAVAELGYVDCTARGRGPCNVRLPSGTLLEELPTTHSLGALARGVLGRRPAYVHAYFHDYDLLHARRRLALELGLWTISHRTSASNTVLLAEDREEIAFSQAFGQ
jgi:hypothetical protein